jgi:hypothetical protein
MQSSLFVISSCATFPATQRQSDQEMRRFLAMVSNKRFVSAIIGLVMIALPATALANDHHWNHHWDHHWANYSHPNYASPRMSYARPSYAVPPTAYARGYNYPGMVAPVNPYATAVTPYATRPYANATSPYANALNPYATAVSPYATAGTGNLSYLMQKRQEAYNAIAAANRSGNTGGAHHMWQLYNNYNKRIAAQGGGAMVY